MKKIDVLLLKSFVGPFIVTFLIALFVLIMQFLWIYIDEIIGKGAGIFIIIELISYLSLSLFPMALPIGVLISSVMVMGNLAERYELASMKSAGMSLNRIMRPLAIVATGIAIFSFICANYLIPITNLQFKSRLYDIRKSKPTLSLEEGVFNDDFQGFTIYLKEKSENGRDIKDILIYNQNTSDGKINQIAAERGEMYTTPDERFFIMNLFNGTQSQEINKRTEKGKRNYSFVRTNFKEYKKVFDLREFDLKETETDLFKSHQTMLNVGQLMDAVDSIDVKIDTRQTKLEKHFVQFLHFEKKRDTVLFNQKPTKPITSSETYPDSKKLIKNKADTTSTKKVVEVPEKNTTKNSISKNRKPKTAKKKFDNKYILQQNQFESLDTVRSILTLFQEKDQKKLLQKALTNVRSIKSQTIGSVTSLRREKEIRVKHVHELHMKFSMAFVCIIFLFVGAPMGAMIQKGGFGYPILISILFFTLFIIMNISFEKLAESLVISGEMGAWFPCLILALFSLFLNYKASKDAKIENIGQYFSKIAAVFSRKAT